MSRASAAVVVVATLVGTTLFLPAQDTQDKVDRIFDRIEESRGAALWEGSRQLEELGRGSTEGVRKGLTRADAFVRVAAARVLYSHELRDEALDALSKVIEGKNAEARRVAIDLIASVVGADRGLTGPQKSKIADDLARKAEQAEDRIAQVALLRAEWALTQRMGPVRKLRDLVESTDRRDVREDAALALAEMDKFIWAKPVLTEMAKEPSERGRAARAYLKLNEASEELSRRAATPAASKYDFRLIEETIDTLKTFYYDESKVSPEKLVEAATRGACASLDAYTMYMDEAQIKQLKEEDLRGEYGGIGARVSMQKDQAGRSWLTITEPIFSGPAYRKGLRSGDRIIEVAGEATMNRELSDMVRKLRGKPATPVTFKVWRRGWAKEQEFTITREQIQLETTIHRMLPGGIGYLKLSTFGEQDVDLVEEAIRDLGKMKALVFDLRGNSGGYLRTAHKIAGYFLERGKVIVSTKGRGVELDPPRTADGNKLTDAPLVVLVDDMSASASEILAGALQDHKRAVLVGEKTYGKGSVQDMKYLKTGGEKTAVKLTISKWYLPSGRSVEKDKHEESGIHPDVAAKEPDRDYWKDAEFERLRAGDEIDRYVKELFEADKELAGALAEADGGETARYPKLDALFESLKTKASKEEVRELVREQLRRRVQDDRGKPMYLDFQTDSVLQTGILEACKLAKVEPKEIKEYKTFVLAPRKAETGK